MEIIISVILIVNFLFTPVFAFASDVSSESNTSYTLQDVLDGNSEAESQLRFIAESFGQSATATIDELLVAPLKAVASSFMATGQDMIDRSLDLLKNNTEFMRSIFINPYTKSFSWGPDAARHGGGEGSSLSDLFHDKVYENVPPGFYLCDYSNYFARPVGARFTYDYYLSSVGDSYFTRIGGDIVICNFSTLNGNNVYMYRYEKYYSTTPPTSNSDGSEQGSWLMNQSTRIDVGDNFYFYSFTTPSLGSDIDKYPVFYDSFDSAARAFYTYEPSSHDVPNGKGYIRPINININASGDNVYNRNWDNVISTNFNDFGADFSLTVVNNYYYDSPSSDTPSYWYDIYDNDSVSAPTGDYDLDDITLSSPELTTNNNFLNTLFGAFPVALSGLFLAFLMLSAVIIFLRG